MAISSSSAQVYTAPGGYIDLPSISVPTLRVSSLVSSVFGYPSQSVPTFSPTTRPTSTSRNTTSGVSRSSVPTRTTYSTSISARRTPSIYTPIYGSTSTSIPPGFNSSASFTPRTSVSSDSPPSSSPSSADMPQSLSNGDSLLGTLDAPTYPEYLGTGYPWGGDTVNNTDPYHNSPTTGVTRHFDFTISNAVIYPDGYKKSVMLVNNQFPGPMLDANWGDMVSVTVHNNLTGEAPQMTAVHWHGNLQHDTQWADGSPGLGQCPIAPGDSLTYQWKAELYGSSWYHAHLSAQWPQGILGPMLIYGPEHEDHDIDLGPVFLSDWYHQSAEVVIRELLEPKDQFVDIPSDNNLINGKNPLPCSDEDARNDVCRPGATYAKFKFQKGKKHKLRLINSGAQAVQKFSIDDHELKVIANDYVPVKPYKTNVVTLGVGQRSDIIVEADQDDDQSYWMRSNATCANNNNPEAKAIIYYTDDDDSDASRGYHHNDDDDDHNDGDGNGQSTSPFSSIPSTTAQEDDSIGRNLACSNDPLDMTEPMYKIPIKEPSITQVFRIEFRQNETGSWVWYMNNNSYLTDFGNPTLNVLSDNNQSYLSTSQRRNPYYIPDDASTYRFIVQNDSPSPHPMHHHGHNSYVLYESDQPWNEDEASKLESRIVRRSNPQRRDVQQVPGNGYLVVQFDADNPGSWGFHCHMAFHIGGGLFTEAIEGTDKLLGRAVPQNVLDGCQKFQAWNNANLADAKVYDSGQKL